MKSQIIFHLDGIDILMALADETFDNFSFFAQHLCLVFFFVVCLLNNFKFHTDCYQNYHGKHHFIYCCCGKM